MRSVGVAIAATRPNGIEDLAVSVVKEIRVDWGVKLESSTFTERWSRPSAERLDQGAPISARPRRAGRGSASLGQEKLSLLARRITAGQRKKVTDLRCGLGDRGEAGLGPDQAKERPCGPRAAGPQTRDVANRSAQAAA